MGAVKSARGYGEANECHRIILREDAMSQAKSHQNVGCDREDREREDQNKERAGEAGECRTEYSPVSDTYSYPRARTFLPSMHPFAAGM
jgi:hypothetical protein